MRCVCESSCDTHMGCVCDIYICVCGGGYTLEQRRELEGQLKRGEIVGLCATNALELGIDIGGIDATVHMGVNPSGGMGSSASLWQQAARTYAMHKT